MTASLQPSKAISYLQRNSDLSARSHPSPKSHRPLKPSPPIGSHIARLHAAVNWACRNDVALSCERSPVQLARFGQYQRMSHTFLFHHTRRTDTPSNTHFLFLVQSHRWTSISQTSPVPCVPLAKCPSTPANPAHPLPAAKSAVWLCFIDRSESSAFYLAGAVTIGALAGSAAFLAS